MIKFAELKKKTEAELTEQLAEAREKLCELRFRASTRELKNIREIRNMKKEIAQILTIMAQSKKKPIQ